MRADRARHRHPDRQVSADGVINAVLLVIVIGVVVYLLAALIVPERF